MSKTWGEEFDKYTECEHKTVNEIDPKCIHCNFAWCVERIKHLESLLSRQGANGYDNDGNPIQYGLSGGNARTSPKMLEPLEQEPVRLALIEAGVKPHIAGALSSILCQRFGTGKMDEEAVYKLIAKIAEDETGTMSELGEQITRKQAKALSQFSRPDVVVTLPKKRDISKSGTVLLACEDIEYNQAIDLCTQALEKQGVRWE